MTKREREILRLLQSHEPRIRSAFLRAVLLATGAASIVEIEALVQSGNIEGIIQAMGLAPALALLVESVRETYLDGGRMEANELTRRAVRVYFDIRNPRAEAWLRSRSSDLVTAITREQREAIRIVLEYGTAAGSNPRATALDIVGRIDRITKRRTGGIVGLTSQQASYVTNARRQLLSGDPAQMTAYFDRKLRDRRFDGIVRRAIAAEKPVSVKDVQRITGRYADRLLNLRGEVIGRTEALQAFSAGRNESVWQMIESGSVRAENVTKRWSSARDGRTRDTHASMHGQVQPFGQPFRSPSGALLMHPGDRSLGAGAAEVISCRCASIPKVDYLAENLG